VSLSGAGVAFGDTDNDGDNDLLISYCFGGATCEGIGATNVVVFYRHLQGLPAIYSIDTRAAFASALNVSSLANEPSFEGVVLPGPAYTLALGDVNGDGFLDLVAGPYLFMNGQSVFASPSVHDTTCGSCGSSLIQGVPQYYKVYLVDMDGDGSLEIHKGFEYQSFGDTNGDGVLDRIVGRTYSVSDVNGVLAANSDPCDAVLTRHECLQDASQSLLGTSCQSPANCFESRLVNNALIVDLDGDGDLDVVAIVSAAVGGSGTEDRRGVFLNRGGVHEGTFQERSSFYALIPYGSFTEGVLNPLTHVFADVDNDGGVCSPSRNRSSARLRAPVL
jgi:hypothetical protein